MTVRADLPSKEIANLLIPRISVSVTGASDLDEVQRLLEHCCSVRCTFLFGQLHRKVCIPDFSVCSASLLLSQWLHENELLWECLERAHLRLLQGLSPSVIIVLSERITYMHIQGRSTLASVYG